MITVYSKSYCPYCDGAKAYLKKIGEEFEVIDVTNDAEKKAWLAEQGHRTVPQIYYQGRLLVEGGHDGLVKLLPADIIARKQAIQESL
jgi:glutaredoxin